MTINLNLKVSIPQAVGAVATGNLKLPRKGLPGCVSIPQAVGAVATCFAKEYLDELANRFNTASGRCCCNVRKCNSKCSY